MDKTKIKKVVGSFATNVALATGMATLAITYTPLVIKGIGLVALLVCDIICFVVDVFSAVADWKKLKKLLGEDEPKQLEMSKEESE